MGGKVGENPAALRAVVFSLSSKNLRGGAFKRPPPSRARASEILEVPGVSKKSDEFILQLVDRKQNPGK